MWVHYCYLLLLPTLAAIAAQMMFPGTDFWQQLLIFGFPSVLMYSLFLANGYTIPNSLPIALIVVLTIPIQLALSVIIFGGGSIWLFFAESAAVEIGSFVLGVLTIAMINRSKDTSAAGFGFLLLLVFLLFVLGSLPHIISVFYGYGGGSLWLVIFVTAFASGYWKYTRVYKRIGSNYQRSGESQELEMRFDGGVLTKFLRLDHTVTLLSPNWSADGRKRSTGPIFVFGITAMFLPLVAGLAVGVIFPQ